MSDHFIGEIMPAAFDGVPQDFVPCDGRRLRIDQYPLLYNVIRTIYGGDGETDFAVPDLRQRVPVLSDDGRGYDIGHYGGDPSIALQASEMPGHRHALNGGIVMPANPAQLSRSPVPGAFTTTSTPEPFYAVGTAPPVAMADAALGSTGGDGAHENRQPFLTINYVIATAGVYPRRDE